MLQSWELVKCSFCKMMGSGDTIFVWKDSWIPSLPDLKSSPRDQNMLCDPKLKVCELVNQNSHGRARATSSSSASDGSNGGVASAELEMHGDSQLCFCGLKARMRMSTTEGNPGKRFFGCP
ncbi:hypothetical protein CJ030_MR7G005499 [Morella rubra]|uniref:Zinc finger GRF-type domain-containing protein n=1 Tax=Morella rubra TaxID=262757 RepID=A0A6A1V4V1_9ROSI|nr:hypothetical protein CJ030_MR7G005499 [Morella rubra]